MGYYADIKEDLENIFTKRNNIMPRLLFPRELGRHLWEQLGFRFQEIDERYFYRDIDIIIRYFYRVKMPEGWKMILPESQDVFRNDCSDVIIIDGYNRKRGSIYYKSYGESEAGLCSRYSPCEGGISHLALENIYFGNEQEVLFFAGVHRRIENVPDELKPAIIAARKLLREAVDIFAEKYYPNYCDKLAYWDEPMAKEEKYWEEIHFGTEQETLFSVGGVALESAPKETRESLEKAEQILKEVNNKFYSNLDIYCPNLEADKRNLPKSLTRRPFSYNGKNRKMISTW